MGTYSKGYGKNFRIVYTVEMEPAAFAPESAKFRLLPTHDSSYHVVQVRAPPRSQDGGCTSGAIALVPGGVRTLPSTPSPERPGAAPSSCLQ